MTRWSIVVVAALALAAPAVAATPPSAPEGEAGSSTSPFEIQGSFDVGFRATDTDGNEDKYFEHINLRNGPRLFNFETEVTPVGSAFFDVFRVEAQNLGGDPFQRLGLTLKNYGDYSFRYHRRQSAYFYKDITVPHDEASISATNGGDFTTFDFVRTQDAVDFQASLARTSKVYFKFNRQSRRGESTMTIDLSRDEFETDRPLDEVKDDYSVGYEFSGQKFSTLLDFTYRDYENDFHTFLPGASLGENPDNTTEIFFFEQETPYDFKMPQGTVRLHFRPSSRFRLTGAFIYSDLEQDFAYHEETRGIAFNGAPIDEVLAGGGGVDRKTSLFDFDLSYDVSSKFALLGGARFRRLDQDGAFNQDGADPVATDWKIDSDIFEAGAQYFGSRSLTLTAGLRFEQRSTTIDGEKDPRLDDALGPGSDTERTTLFFNGVWRPNDAWSLLGEYERGDYDNPFTTMSLSSLNRFKLRLRGKPREDVTFVAAYLLRDNENDGVGLSGSKIKAATLTASLTYSPGDLDLFARYTYRDLDNEIVQTVTTAPGFGGGQEFLFPALYDSKLNLGSAGLRYDFTPRFAAGGDLTIYGNTGSFGVDWQQYRVFAQVTTPQGYRLRAAYRYNNYDEKDFDFDDYSANILTFSVGRSF